jgi:hypothetical protein
LLIGYEQQKMLGVRLKHPRNRGDYSIHRLLVEFSNFCDDHAASSSGRFQSSANERSLKIAVSCVSEFGSSSRILTSARRTPVVFERKLHKLVCAGQLDLKTAQYEVTPKRRAAQTQETIRLRNQTAAADAALLGQRQIANLQPPTP